MLGQVRGELLDRLGRRIVAEVRAAGPAIVDELAEEFNDVAENFTDAFRRLPTNYADAAHLVDAGADAVAAYERARATMHVLDGLRGRRDFLARLGVKAAGPTSIERGTRYTSVTNTAAAERAADALNAGVGPLGVWGNLLAVNGVEAIQWRGVEAHAAYIAALPEAKDRFEMVTNHGFRGLSRVEA